MPTSNHPLQPPDGEGIQLPLLPYRLHQLLPDLLLAPMLSRENEAFGIGGGVVGLEVEGPGGVPVGWGGSFEEVRRSGSVEGSTVDVVC